MNSSIKIKVRTPYKEYFNLDVKRVSTESIKGRLEILPNHSKLITVLNPSITEIEDLEGKKHKFSNSSGIMKVENGQIKMVCENIELK